MLFDPLNPMIEVALSLLCPILSIQIFFGWYLTNIIKNIVCCNYVRKEGYVFDEINRLILKQPPIICHKPVADPEGVQGFQPQRVSSNPYPRPQVCK